MIILAIFIAAIIAVWFVARKHHKHDDIIVRKEPLELDECPSCGSWKLKDKPLCAVCMYDLHHHG